MTKRRAFTLTEVIVSTLIVAVIAAGMFGAFVGARYFFRSARHKMQAYNFAREVQDRLRANYTYDDSLLSALPADNPHSASDIGFIVRGEMAELNPAPVVTYKVTEPEAGYKKIKVTVSWQEVNLP